MRDQTSAGENAASESDDVGEPSELLTNAEALRMKYFEARKFEAKLYAMTLARKVAEGICRELAPRVPEDLRKHYVSQSSLGGKLSFLDNNIRLEKIQLPRLLIAALKTLHAYGNYASHYDERAQIEADPLAARSAMASLALVTNWSLEKSDDAPSEVKVRSDPGRPGWFARRRLDGRVTARTPGLPSGRNGGLGESVALKLNSIHRFYEQSALLCEEISRVVLTRETEVEGLAELELDKLIFILEKASDQVPHRIPRSMVQDVQGVALARNELRQAIQEGKGDVDALVEEIRHRNRASDVRAWFQRQYLGRGSLERQPGMYVSWVLLIALVCAVVVDKCSQSRVDGRFVLRKELVGQYCADDESAASRICVDLRAEIAEEVRRRKEKE